MKASAGAHVRIAARPQRPTKGIPHAPLFHIAGAIPHPNAYAQNLLSAQSRFSTIYPFPYRAISGPYSVNFGVWRPEPTPLGDELSSSM